ncbi:uncharacterized protein F4822DRAFT_410282 [Hypoxylon trugodes]|uniref:uncharacterized protein n=1 Tax=Hypoxylon trugodes TaxID=326681 RepID=UPI0021A064CA|nr:uncharacterized protein F4822DRAFT_410282 [Hypoxylon trugodes]KAI1386492.1 hypothetical protein F4822DRAFT_410282 [Hypoxylon trugodes]
MASFSSWFSRKSSQSKPVDSPSILQANKVISGRVTKPVLPAKIKTHEKLTGATSEATDEYEGVEATAMLANPTDPNDPDFDLPNENDEEDYRNTSEIIDESDYRSRFADQQAYYDHVYRKLKSPVQSSKPPPSDSSTPSSSSSSPEPDTDDEYDEDEGWRVEQVFLNHILKARDEYTFMPSTWKMHFRGIPLPEGLFYQQSQTISTRPRIYSRTDRYEYRGAMALRKLIDLHGRIYDFRKEHSDDPRTAQRIVDVTRQGLVEALHWAEIDGDLAKYSNSIVPNVRIFEMQDMDRLDMDVHIQDEMSALGTAWREALERVPEEGRPKAPVVFGFVIFKHIVFIVTLDANNPDAFCHIPCQLNMSERNQHQWNALAIMVTVCWARDIFMEVVKDIPISELDKKDEDSSSDPDA